MGVGYVSAGGDPSDEPATGARGAAEPQPDRAEVVAALTSYADRAPAVQTDVELHGPVVGVTCDPTASPPYRGATVWLCSIQHEDGMAPIKCAALADGVLHTSDREPELPCPKVGLPAPVDD
ncbi:MAG: hypothetical protein M3321_04155 [Actinomycetota bacterium]|nr:hypothetical protein [Actinomycetota bacterium]